MAAERFPRRRRWYWSLFMCGAAGTLVQVCMIRELLFFSTGNELLIGAALGVWLFWNCAGALVSSGITPGRSSVSWFLATAAASALVPPAACAVLPAMLSSGGRIVGAGHGLWAILVTLAPLALLTGGTFPLAYRMIEAEGESGAAAYAADVFGSFAAGVSYTLVLASTLVSWRIGGIAGAIYAAVPQVWKAEQGPADEGAGPRFPSYACTAATALCLAVSAAPVERALLESFWSRLHPEQHPVEWFVTPYGEYVIGRNRTLYSLYGDGGYICSFPDPEDILPTISVCLALHPHPGRILLLGAGYNGVGYAAASSCTGGLERVFLDERLDAHTARFLCGLDHEWMKPGKNTVLRYDDPRRFLSAANSSRYDIIISMQPPPSNLSTNRMYTEEFFRLARSRLSDGGLLLMALPIPENYLGEDAAAVVCPVVGAAAGIFPEWCIVPGQRTFVALGAADSPLPPEKGAVEKRLEEMRRALGKAGDYAHLAFASMFLDPWKTKKLRTMVEERLKRYAPNTDERPVAVFSHMKLVEAMAGGGGSSVLERLRKSGGPTLWWLAAALPFVLLLVIRWRKGDAEAVSTVYPAGFSAMLLQMVIMFAYQTVHGALYSSVGALIGTFMLGLGAGAWLVRNRGADRRTAAVLHLCTMLLALAVPALAFEGGGASQVFFFLSSFLSGLFTGGRYPLALALSGNAVHLVSIYDLGAGMVAAMETTAGMIPLVGMWNAGMVLVLLEGAGMALLWAAGASRGADVHPCVTP